MIRLGVTIPDLESELRSLLRQIPRGRVTTYGDVATALGDVKAARWVAEVLLEPTPELAHAAHRVVKLTGEPGRFPANALELLAAEGIPIAKGRVVLDEVRFSEFESTRPLTPLREEQQRLASRAKICPLASPADIVAAVDVSYRRDGFGVAAYVVMVRDEPRPVWSATVCVKAPFPYIPGYLAYRELPLHADLLEQAHAAGQAAPLLLVDGAGLLHPRRSGVATQLGVLADLPTIGVTKHALCGSVVMDESFGPGTGRVVDKGETIGAALSPPRRGTRPIYVSVGHRCTLADAVAVVTSWRGNVRLPEPIRAADALSRSVARSGLEGR